MWEEITILVLSMFAIYFAFIIVASHVTLYLIVFKGHKVDKDVLVMCIFITIITIIIFIAGHSIYQKIKEKRNVNSIQ